MGQKVLDCGTQFRMSTKRMCILNIGCREGPLWTVYQTSKGVSRISC